MVLMVSIFVLNLWLYIVNKDFTPFYKIPHWKFGSKLMVVLIVPTAVFLGLEHTIKVISTNTILRDSEVVARLGEREITLGEVNHGIRLSLNQIEWKRYEMMLSWIENELMKMEADRQGVSLKQLKKENIDDAITISEEEMQKFYQSYQKKLSEKIPYQKVKGKILTHLKKEKMKSMRQEFLTQLKQRYNVSFLLPKPIPLDFNENPQQGPEKGPAESAITIVFFTDFECPFCGEAYRKIKDLLARYPQDVRVIFRHFPLKIHKDARDAAYAAACAHLQGKFWPYADLLFKNQGKLTVTELYDYADQVGLDMSTFKQCMELGKGKKIVEADISDGLDLGLNTTPVLFFNGHFIKGFPKPGHLQLILDQYLPATDSKKTEG
jgi:protein-disulfide isomerase